MRIMVFRSRKSASRHRGRAVAAIAVLSLLTTGLVVLPTTPSGAATFAETVGGDAHTWTNYTNAGGTQGPTIPAFNTVQITCALPGFRVADGNTWWYQIASSPWNNRYYVSADAFYNNGQTSGSLHGTPFVDPAVPTCASIAGGTSETTGGAANTWTNYTNAGGTQGPTIGGGATVQIACAVTGFRVADGNTWWYQIASSPWNHAYYVSADAFYNNGQTSGSLHGTPFVDPAVPLCSSSSGSGGGRAETTGGAANTWTNYSNAGGTQGPTIGGGATVQIACKITGFRVADGNTWWYQIASAPWNNGFYVSADAFYNNGATSGSLIGTPFVDPAVPDCAATGLPRPSGETTGGSTSTFGNYSHAGVPGPTIPAFTTLQVACRVTGFRVADGNTWWYLIASAPWNSVYYASADAFYNNGQTSGSLHGTPFVDTAVPICVNNHEAPIYSTAYGSSTSSSHASSHSTSCLCGDPVNSASGDFYDTATDISVPARGPGLKLVRTYNDLGVGSAGLFGNGWTSTYDQHLTLNSVDGSIQITLEDGSQMIAQPDGSGGFVLPASANSTLALNGDGTYTLTQRQMQLLDFNSTGKLVALRDRNGYKTTLGYSGSQLARVTDDAGRVVHVTRGSNGLISSVTDPLGRVTSYVYDANGNLTSVSDRQHRTTTYGYDSNNRMTTVTDPRGGVLRNSYDEQGRVTTQTDAIGNVTTFSYTGDNFSSLGGTTTITDARGIAEVLQYANGFLTRDIKASGTPVQATWTYQYDPSSFGVTSSTDPNGHVTTHTYDAAGYVLTTTDPLGHTTTYTYSAFGETLTTTSPLGETVTNSYDGKGNRLTSRGLSGEQTTYAHADAAHPGDVTSITDPLGRLTRITYDAFGDLASHTTSPASGIANTATFMYDADGEQVCVASPRVTATGVHCPSAGLPRVANTTTTAYNADGQPTSVTDPLGRTTSNTYDANGNKTRVTDPLGHVTNYTYDALNRVTKTLRADGSAILNTYDGNGNLVSTKDGNGRQTTKVYDALNRLTLTTDPLGHTTAYSYDAAGNRSSLVDASGRTTTYAYDAGDHLSAISFSDGTTHGVIYTYDADGRRTTMTDKTGTTHYSYNARGDVTSVIDAAGRTVGYSYDVAGQVTAISYPSGKVVTRGYDKAGNLTSVTDWLGHKTTFGYDRNSNLITEKYGSAPAVTDTSSFNLSDNLTSIADRAGTKTLQSFNYTRNADSLVASSAAGGQPATAYVYDAANQLIHDGAGSYSYDHAGNMTSAPTNAPRTYDVGSQLVSAGPTATATTYAYDAQGSRISATPHSGSTTTYAYDQAAQLIGLTSGSTVATYSYNGDGLRMSKQVGSTATAFSWDSATNSVPLVLTAGNTSYIYGPGGRPIESITLSTPLFFHDDQLGSTTMLTNAAGATVATFTYNSYGQLKSRTGTVANALGYAGQYQDAESGLYYLRARYYSPATAVFLTVDPALSTTHAPYSYANNDPVNEVDPRGTWPSWNTVKFFWNELPPVSAWNAGYRLGSAIGNQAITCIRSGFGSNACDDAGWEVAKSVGNAAWSFVPVAPFVDWWWYYQGQAGDPSSSSSGTGSHTSGSASNCQ
jgi:RHS repeat-associated protein